MTTAIHLCTEADAPRLADFVVRARAELGQDASLEDITGMLAPLLADGALGAAWLFGPSRAPTGYVILSFRFSLASGGMIAVIEDIYVRPAIRRRGIASEVLIALGSALSDGGIAALTVEVDAGAESAAAGLATRAGLTSQTNLTRMTRAL